MVRINDNGGISLGLGPKIFAICREKVNIFLKLIII